MNSIIKLALERQQLKPVLLKDVKKGCLFLLTDKVQFFENGEVLSKYVYVRSDYDRELKKYEVYKFDDCCKYRFLRGNRIVWVNFVF